MISFLLNNIRNFTLNFLITPKYTIDNSSNQGYAFKLNKKYTTHLTHTLLNYLSNSLVSLTNFQKFNYLGLHVASAAR